MMTKAIRSPAFEHPLANGRERSRVWPGAVGYILLGVAGAVIPLLLGSTLLFTLLTQAVIGALLATSVGCLVRQNGLVSFGHAAFFGLAGYILALSIQHHLMPPELAFLIGIVVAATLAFVLGLVFLKLSGVAFSMMTLAVAQALHEIFLRWRELANGEDGIRLDLPDSASLFGLKISIFQQPDSMFLVCWISLIVILLVLWILGNSKFGTLILAIRENEERARFIGYGTRFPRAFVYALSAAIAALAGLLSTLYNSFVTPESLDWGLSGEVLIMAIIGGTRSVWGPALGAVLFFFLKGAISDVTEHWPAFIGLLLILTVILAPTGLSGLMTKLGERVKGEQA